MSKPINMRRCVVCRQSFHKSELLRIVKTNTGEISFDENGKVDGRGAYVCNSPECIAAVKKRRNFDKVFKAKVPAEIYDKLDAESAKETIRM